MKLNFYNLRFIKSCIAVVFLFTTITNDSFGQINFPFTDTVSDSTTTMNNWSNTSTSWSVVNVGASNAHSDSLVWECYDHNNGWYYITKNVSMDLTTPASRNPYLSFWYRNNQSGYTYVSADVSTNNGSSWTTIKSSSLFQSTSWNRIQCSLYNYRYSNVIVRIGFHRYSNECKLWVDDIIVDNAPEPTVLTLSDATNNGMKLTWGKSTADDFDFYRIRVSNSSSGTSYSSSSYSHSASNRTQSYVFTKDNINDTTMTLSWNNYPLYFCKSTYYAQVFEADTQAFVNQGTTQQSLATTWSMDGLNTPAAQNFDSASTPQWAADYPWRITSADSGQTGHSSPNAFEDSPDDNYDPDADRYLYSKWYMPSTPMAHPILKFNQKHSINSGDLGQLYYSLNGNNWNELMRYSGSNSNWHEQEFSVPEFQNNGVGSPVYLRWRIDANNSSENSGWSIDDVEISETTHTYTSFPLTEDFEDSSDVESKWVLSNFTRHYTTTAQNGTYVISSNNQIGGIWQYMTLGTPLDLSSTTNPYLSFWNRMSSNGYSYFRVSISTDGGRNWSDIQGSSLQNYTDWRKYQYSLKAFRSSSVLIRLGYHHYSNVDLWYDNIVIDEAPEAHSVTLSNATNNGMTVTWDSSTANDFSAYRIIISTSSNNLGYSSATYHHGVSQRSEQYIFTETSKTTTSMTLDTSNYPLTFCNATYYAKVYEIDTQGYYNEGTNSSSLATANNMDSETAPLTQDFDSTNVAQWRADWPWAVTETSADSVGHSSPNCYEDTPGTYYDENFDRYLVGKWTLPISITRPIITFNYISKYSSSDYCELSYSLNGSNYTNLTRFYDESNGGYGWLTYELNASFLRNNAPNQPIYLRFRSYSNNSTNNDGFFLDDVNIYQNPRADLTFPFNDDVEDSSTTHNKIIPGEFTRTVTGSAHSGSYVWKSPRKNGIWYYLTMGTPIDLTGVSNPYFSFWWKNAQSGYSYYSVEVSTDGGKNWTNLKGSTLRNYTTWTQETLSLYNYRSTQTMLRIGYHYYSDVDFYIDDIMITNSPTLISPADGSTNVPLYTDFSWTESSTSSDYQIQIATDNGFSNLVVDDSLSTTEYSNSTSFSTSTQHYWRIRGLNNETSWTNAFDFTTSNNTIQPPELVSPSDGAQSIGSSHTFTWNTVDSANSYRIQVSIDRGFSSTTIDTVVTDTSFYSDGDMQSGTTYYWRARAHKTSDTSIYSSSNIFAVASGECGAISKYVEATIKMHGFWDGSKHAEVPITLELRSGPTLMTSTLIERKSGIIDTTGIIRINFCRQNDGNYWLIARAAGFLPLGSTSQISLSTTTATYNFTSASSTAAGGERALYNDSGTWLMRSGELTNDRRITASDNSNFIINNGRSLQDVVPEK